MAGNSTSSQSSGITGGDLSCFVDDQDEISTMEVLEKEAMSSEWTDEKHSLYLKSIETSFVQQLYNSMEINGLHSHRKHSSYTRSSEWNEFCSADKFKVHQHGYWQRIKFGRGEPPPPKTGKSRIILQNPWIQHFRSRDNPTIQGYASYGDEPVSFGETAVYTHALANISDDFHICPTVGDSSIDEGFSGQNFDDEENDVRTCSLHTTKRMKMHTTKRMKTVEAIAKNHE